MFILLAGCLKNELNKKPKNDYHMQVEEYKTNLPLQGVKIELLHCENYTAADRCIDTGIVATYTTDENGEASFNSGMVSTADRGIRLSKFQYFTKQGGEGENFMEPEAWVRVTLKAGKIYPDTCLFTIGTESELGIGSSLTVTPPKDSIIHLRLFGNETNKIAWAVVTKRIPCYMGCPQPDTFALGNLTVSPGKFETVNASLVY